ncbi:unnamed protein product [Oncorhynchus mykiss]|uniref:Phosphoribosylformylglycinamidine synthase N-terminal domain-containing protein n=1 Tax=Oncorhynchus mykiss TaxID=8022 RepID=A0A060XF56_ONCMY|nr:unnamed protein product [Oncorhynchus mykiss]
MSPLGFGKKNNYPLISPSLVMAVVRFYSKEAERGCVLQTAAQLHPQLSITSELCYNVELTGAESLSVEQREVLLWLFRPTLQTEQLSDTPYLTEGEAGTLVEIGPRLNFSTAWSTNAVSICQSAGLTNVTRVELSRRLLIQPKDGQSEKVLDGEVERLVSSLYDSMTECVYTHPISSFTVATKPQEVFEVDILEKGRAALETANDELGKYHLLMLDISSGLRLVPSCLPFFLFLLFLCRLSLVVLSNLSFSLPLSFTSPSPYVDRPTLSHDI